MSGDPADWLRQIAENIRTDPGLPPGVISLESDVELTRVARVIQTGLHRPVTEAFYEDCRSLMESSLYVIRLGERGEPVRCECCGTLVMTVPEALTVSAGGEPPVSRRWERGIWEDETLRRHTPRRCERRRANG